MKFSIIIPLYNGGGFIEKTLDSVLAQTYKDYEIVLINDESPDNVDQVVNQYNTNHPETRFVYLEQKNKGLGGARNTAIRRSSGEIIAILDQDDIWYPDKLEKVAGIYRENKDVSIVCHNQYVRNRGIITNVFVMGSHEEKMHRKLLLQGNCLSTSATTFRRAVIDDVGYFSEQVNKLHFVEDYELWLRMAYKGHRFYFMPEILGEYTIHGANYSQHEIICKGELFVLNQHYRLLKHKRLFDRLRIQKRKSDCLLVVAYNLFFHDKRYFAGALYLLRAIANYPFVLARCLKIW